MEFLIPILSALTSALSLLSAIWIYRKAGANSIHFMFSLCVIIYASYQFIACAIGVIDPGNSVISNLFIILVIVINAHRSSYIPNNMLNIGVDRRKTTGQAHSKKDDRRLATSHTLLKDVINLQEQK